MFVGTELFNYHIKIQQQIVYLSTYILSWYVIYLIYYKQTACGNHLRNSLLRLVNELFQAS